MRVEHHLLGLARVGPHERHPAVAEPHVRDLDRHGDAVDQYDLVAPVELVGFAGIEAQRHKGRRRSRASLAPPGCSVATNGVIAALVAETAQVLEDPQQRHPLAAAPRSIRSKKPLELLAPGAKLRMRLNPALILERGRLGPQDLPHDLARQLQLTADLLDRLAVDKMRPADHGDRLHNHHPEIGSQFPREHCEPRRQRGPFWGLTQIPCRSPITPQP
jgi:hypothetical protein